MNQREEILIESLRVASGATEHTWWVKCADRAIETGHWGLAKAWFSRAAVLEPNLYVDMPTRAQAVLEQIESHLRVVRGRAG